MFNNIFGQKKSPSRPYTPPAGGQQEDEPSMFSGMEHVEANTPPQPPHPNDNDGQADSGGMFGGMSMAESAPSPVNDGGNLQNILSMVQTVSYDTPAAEPAMGGFSFLGADAVDEPATDEGAATGGFGFLGDSTDAAPDDAADAADASSGFSFLDQADADAPNAIPAEPSDPAAGPSFSFMSQPEGSSGSPPSTGGDSTGNDMAGMLDGMTMSAPAVEDNASDMMAGMSLSDNATPLSTSSSGLDLSGMTLSTDQVPEPSPSVSGEQPPSPATRPPQPQPSLKPRKKKKPQVRPGYARNSVDDVPDSDTVPPTEGDVPVVEEDEGKRALEEAKQREAEEVAEEERRAKRQQDLLLKAQQREADAVAQAERQKESERQEESERQSKVKETQAQHAAEAEAAAVEAVAAEAVAAEAAAANAAAANAAAANAAAAKAKEESMRIAEEEALNAENARLADEERLKKQMEDASPERSCQLIIDATEQKVAHVRTRARQLREEQVEAAKLLQASKNLIADVRVKRPELEREQAEACHNEDYERADQLDSAITAATQQCEGLEAAIAEQSAQVESLNDQRRLIALDERQAREQCATELGAVATKQRNHVDDVVDDMQRTLEKSDKDVEMKRKGIDVQLSNMDMDIKFANNEQEEIDSKIYQQTNESQEELKKWQGKRSAVRGQIEELQAQIQALENEDSEYATHEQASNSQIELVRRTFERQLNRLESRRQDIEDQRSHVEEQEAALQAIEDANRIQKEKQLEAEASMQAELLKVTELLESCREGSEKLILSQQGMEQHQKLKKEREQKYQCTAAEHGRLYAQFVSQKQDREAVAARLMSSQQDVTAGRKASTEMQAQILELEVNKKAAASARNFKEAKAAQDAIKLQTATFESRHAEVASLDAVVETLKSELSVARASESQLDEQVKESERARDFSRIESLNDSLGELEVLVTELSEQGQLEDAELLQSELQAQGLELASLCSHWDIPEPKRPIRETAVPDQVESVQEEEEEPLVVTQPNAILEPVASEVASEGESEGESVSDAILSTELAGEESDQNNDAVSKPEQEETTEAPDEAAAQEEVSIEEQLQPLMETMSQIYALEAQIEEATEEEDYDTAESLDAECTDLKAGIDKIKLNDPRLAAALDEALATS